MTKHNCTIAFLILDENCLKKIVHVVTGCELGGHLGWRSVARMCFQLLCQMREKSRILVYQYVNEPLISINARVRESVLTSDRRDLILNLYAA